jgi:hypothetical protein
MEAPTPSPAPLIQTLKASGCPKCVQVASSLEETLPHDKKAQLSFRNLDLDAAETSEISNLLQQVPAEGIAWIRSLSFSYNENLGDEGAVVLAQFLPIELEEFGLVRCRISDVGGYALLEWAKKATRLAMMCIEGNHLSEEMKGKFRQLATQRPSLLMVV